jgi:hypothetical protein
MGLEPKSNANEHWNKDPKLLVIPCLLLNRISAIRRKERQKKLSGCEMSPANWSPTSFPFRKAVVVTVGGDFRAVKPPPSTNHHVICHRAKRGRERGRSNEKKSMNVVEIVVLFASQVFGVYFYWLKEAREKSTHGQWLRVGLRASQKTCLSAGNQESHNLANRVKLVLTTISKNIEVCITQSRAWLKARVLYEHSFLPF